MDIAGAPSAVADLEPQAGGSAKKFQEVIEILSAIVGNQPLPATMQRIAKAFVVLYPSKGIAIFSRAGPQFRIEAEAGLPPRVATPVSSPPGSRPPLPFSEAGKFGWKAAPQTFADAALSCPPFQEILQSGVKLCFALPLLSAAGETRGAISIFSSVQGKLDSQAEETVRILGDLARLAIEHRELFVEVVHRSQYDSLTGLPNRLLLEDRLGQAMVIARRQGTLLAVCSLDIDRFQQINDSLGHEFGDKLFKLISQRLQGSIREIDTLARHGGDEFIVLLRDLADTTDAALICDRLLKDLSKAFLVEGHSLHVTASVGISIFPDHGGEPGLLLRNADLALLAAKNVGRSQVSFYSPGFGKQTRRAAEMLEALVSAVARSEFHIAYQPVFNMHREIVGFEALLRWKHPGWSPVSPLEFIPLAEKNGLIVSIGDWVIDEVCRQAMQWNAAGMPPVKIYVNISGVQLAHPDFAGKIATALERSGLAPNRLQLEITESWIIADLKGAAGKLQTLRNMGIGIAIDDFGTGYSTFNYLHELPLDTLKIDRSFIHRLDGSAANLSTVRAITGLAHQLGLKTVAEGVESEHHLTQLSEIGCDLIQGFFLARPLSPQAACSLLKKQQNSALLNASRPVAARSPAESLTH